MRWSINIGQAAEWSSNFHGIACLLGHPSGIEDGWTSADRKQAVIDELREKWVPFEGLRERAERVKKRDVFTPYDDVAVLRVQPLSELGTPVELVTYFGGKDGYLAAVRTLEDELYRETA